MSKATEWKLAASSCGNAFTEDLFRSYAENGVRAMEVSVGNLADAEKADYAAIKRYAEKYGVELWSFHLPFCPFEIIDFASLDEKIRRNTVKMGKKYVRIAADLGVKVMVVHPSGEPNLPENRQNQLALAGEALSELADFAAEYGITVAVEDLPRTCLGNCSADIAALLAANDKLRVCFDTNHLLGENNVDFVHAVGDKIVTLHVSDYDFHNERHWLPGEGKVDWQTLVAALEEVGYNGPFLYEINLLAEPTIVRRALTHADFAENYRACVTKTAPRVLGTPNEEECRKRTYC